jgi:hypothetical protein
MRFAPTLRSTLLFVFAACAAPAAPESKQVDDVPPPGTSEPSDAGPVTTDSGHHDADDSGEPESPWTPPVETGPVTFPYTAYKCGYAIRQVSPAKPDAIFHDAAAGSAATPKNLHLTIAGDAATSVVVQWSTDIGTKQTEVRFGDAPDKLEKTAHGFSFVSGSRRQHELHLCGLKPGTTFYYDAGGPAARSKVHKVTTAPDAATEVTLLVGGDTRSDPSVWGSMEANALAQGPTAMLLSGDAVLSGGQQSQWDALFESSPDLFAEVPGLWAHGNHEALDELYFQQLALPDHGDSATTEIEQWFATTYGPLRIVVLNDTVASGSQISGVEKQFLEENLKAVDRARTPFVATMHHKPMYTTSSGHSSNTNLRAQWGPLLDQYKVEIDIAGHVHSYESTHPIKAGTTTVTTEATGTRFFNFGGGGAGLYGFAANQPFIKMRETTNGIAILKVTATMMTWTAFRRDGSTLETIAIPKR